MDEIERTVKTLFEKGDVIEIRLKKGGKWFSGYYDFAHFDKLGSDVKKFDELNETEAIYFTVNPVQNVLLARRNCRIDRADVTTTDEQTKYRRYIPIDIDPERPTKTSSTDEQHEASIETAFEVRDFLLSQGWPEPIIADSGNGAHLLCRIDEPNTPGTLELVDSTLSAIIQNVEAPHGIKIEKWANAARIWKLYGTKNRKGDELPDMNIMHRRSKFLEVPEKIEIVSTEQLEGMASMVKKPETAQVKPQTTALKPVAHNRFSLKKWMSEHGVKVVRTKNDSEKSIYVLETCLMNSSHTGNKEAAIIEYGDGKLAYKCHHNTCEGVGWKDVRAKLEPGYRKKKEVTSVDINRLTDWGNAKRIVSKYGQDIRYCPEMREWYVWDGEVWKIDTEGFIYQLAKKTAQDLWSTAQKVTDLRLKEKIVKFAIASENQSRIKNMIESAQNEPGIPISFSGLDLNRDFLGVGNGYINLRTGELLPFDKKYYITKKANASYDLAAECPKFLKFLKEIVPDKNIRGFLQRFFGYSITGQTSEQVFCIFYGHGGNGKGTLVDTIMDIMGEYAKTTEPETIIQKRSERTSTNDLADLKGARWVTTSENEANQILDEGRVKRITGQDKLKCRFLYKEFFEYIPEFKLTLLTNHEPIIKAQDYSIWRRVLKIPFEVTIPKEKWDIQIREKMVEERDGILKWLVEGAKEWYKNGLMVPDVIRIATDEYKSELDILGDFLEQFCTVEEGVDIVYKDLYISYKNWCTTSNIKPKSSNSLSRELNERNFKTIKKNGIRYKKGIDFNSEIKKLYGRTENIMNEKTIAGSIGSIYQDFVKVPKESKKYKSYTNQNKTDPLSPPDSVLKNKKSTPITKTPPHSVIGKCGMCNTPHPEEDLEDDPKKQIKICRECQVQLINKFNSNNSNNNYEKSLKPKTYSDMIKIKLEIPLSEFVIGGTKYSLKRGDITKVPREKGELLIFQGKATLAPSSPLADHIPLRERIKSIRDIILKLQHSNGNLAELDNIQAEATAQGITDTPTILTELKRTGQICEVSTNKFKAV